MVKVIYREHGQQADLAGKSVAEVRELYKSEFSIPNRAKASLNGKQLKGKLEQRQSWGMKISCPSRKKVEGGWFYSVLFC